MVNKIEKQFEFQKQILKVYEKWEKIVFIKSLQEVKIVSIFINMKEKWELKYGSINRANNLQFPNTGKQQWMFGTELSLIVMV